MSDTAPKVPKAPKEPKAPKAPKAPKEPKAPKAPKAPKVPKVPKVPNAPKKPRAPKAPNMEPDITHGGVIHCQDTTDPTQAFVAVYSETIEDDVPQKVNEHKVKDLTVSMAKLII